MTEEGKNPEFSFYPLVYYQKPAIGTESTDSGAPPVQLVYPSGGFAVGIPVKSSDRPARAQDERFGYGVLSSAPMNQSIDIHQKQSLANSFLLLGFVNLVITVLMFSHANDIDLSKVEPGHGSLPTLFEKLSTTRTPTEQLNYGFILFVLILGCVSVVIENVLGISAYCLAVSVNFFLATYSLPYFLYSFRYLLDFAMLYMALVYRSRLMYTYLPINLHNQ